MQSENRKSVIQLFSKFGFFFKKEEMGITAEKVFKDTKSFFLRARFKLSTIHRKNRISLEKHPMKFQRRGRKKGHSICGKP